MTAVLLSILGSAAAAGAGAAAARRSLKGGTIASLVLLGVVLAKLALSRLPAAEARLISWDGYPCVEPWITLGPALFAFGAGLFAARHSRLKRDLLMILAGILLLKTGVAAGAGHDGLRGRVDAAGFCPQTSPYS
jgi:hypothetical protein